MISKFLKGASILLLCLLPLLLFYWVHRLKLYDYQQFIPAAAKFIDKEKWIGYLTESFPEKKFKLLQLTLASGLVVYFSGLLYLIRNRHAYAEKISGIYGQGRELIFRTITFFSHRDLREKKIIPVVILIVSAIAIWDIVTLPMQYDEMWTYNYFIRGSFLKTVVLPGNNHHLFSAAASLFDELPFHFDWYIRLPSCVAGVISIFVFWRLAAVFFHPNSIVISVSFFSTCMLMGMYIVLARSYAFVLLFSVLLVCISYKLESKNPESIYKFLYVLTLVLGYWSNPIFFYTHISILASTCILGLNNRRLKNFFSQFKLSLYSLPILVILYLPDILSSHGQNLYDAAFHSQSPDLIRLFFSTNFYLAWFQLGFKKAEYIYFLIMVFPLLLTWKYIDQRFAAIICCVGLVVRLGSAIIQQVQVSEQMMIYMNVLTALALGLILNRVSIFRNLKLPGLALLAMTIIVLNVKTVHSPDFLYWSRQSDRINKEITHVMLSNQVDSCYLFESYFKPGILFYSTQAGAPIGIAMADSKSRDYVTSERVYSYPAVITNAIEDDHLHLNDSHLLAYKNEKYELWIRRK